MVGDDGNRLVVVYIYLVLSLLIFFFYVLYCTLFR